MDPRRRLLPAVMALAALWLPGPGAAQLYKWVDESGATHYSDRKPDERQAAGPVKPVEGSLSVYSPDDTLLRAVANARERAARNETPAEPERVARPPYATPVLPQPQPPLAAEPCVGMDCAAYYPVVPAYPPLRHGRRLNQAVLPPGATAGTINSPGIIPGNTGTTPRGTAGHPEPRKPVQARHSRQRTHTPHEPRFPAH